MLHDYFHYHYVQFPFELFMISRFLTQVVIQMSPEENGWTQVRTGRKSGYYPFQYLHIFTNKKVTPSIWLINCWNSLALWVNVSCFGWKMFWETDEQIVHVSFIEMFSSLERKRNNPDETHLRHGGLFVFHSCILRWGLTIWRHDLITWNNMTYWYYARVRWIVLRNFRLTKR